MVAGGEGKERGRFREKMDAWSLLLKAGYGHIGEAMGHDGVSGGSSGCPLC
jgi:hypothetical protein